MGDAGTPAETPSVWAIPVAADTVALWCELAAGAVDVSLSPDTVSCELIFKRRLITRGRRLHLFVFRTRGFSVSALCGLSFRPERGRPQSRLRCQPALAPWPTASVAAVVHAIIEGLQLPGADPVDMRLLVRFLSLTASWALPCRVRAEGGGANAAVFEFDHGSPTPTTIVAATAGSLTLQRVIPVSHGGGRTCLLWQGDPFDRGFVEHEGNLLELKLHASPAVGSSLSSWFASLDPEQQDGIMEGFRIIVPDKDTAPVAALGRHLPAERTFRLGQRNVRLVAAVALGSDVCVALRDAGDAEVSLTIAPYPGSDRPVTSRIPAEACGASDGAMVCSRSVHIGSVLADGSPLQVTLDIAGVAETHWLSVLGTENAAARRRIRTALDWQGADEGLVQDFASALAKVRPEPPGPPPNMIAVSSFDAAGDAAVFVCRYAGDMQSLRSTLIAFALTTDGLAVRIVTARRLALHEILDLRDLCQSLRLPAALVSLDEGMPFSQALRSGGNASPPRVLVLADSGVAPLEPDWWHRVASLLGKDPTLLCYGFPEPHGVGDRSASSFLRGPRPVMIAGAQISEDVLPGRLEFQTFEGTIHHALGAAERAGCAEHLPWLRLMAGPRDRVDTPFGAIRLDEAVAEAALKHPPADAPERMSNLVQLAVRGASH